jgi:hypothetical protein
MNALVFFRNKAVIAAWRQACCRSEAPATPNSPQGVTPGSRPASARLGAGIDGRAPSPPRVLIVDDLRESGLMSSSSSPSRSLVSGQGGRGGLREKLLASEGSSSSSYRGGPTSALAAFSEL